MSGYCTLNLTQRLYHCQDEISGADDVFYCALTPPNGVMNPIRIAKAGMEVDMSDVDHSLSAELIQQYRADYHL